MLRVRLIVLGVVLAAQAMAAGWDPKLAASYLDGRQKQWFEWAPAKRTGGPCVSCHGGLTYLIARPMLRQALGETAPTQWETGLREALRARAGGRDAKAILGYDSEPKASQALGVESIFAALFVPDSAPARKRLWDLQKEKGEWNWFTLELDPWENDEAPFFGATLAALTLNDQSPMDGQAALRQYLTTAAASQPLQNRLALLWTAKGLPGVARREWIDDAFAKQEKDGGWTAASLGPWKVREKAPPASGSDAYATAFAAFTLVEAGVPAKDARLTRALDWLRAKQNRETGAWDAISWNKKYPAGSVQEGFMTEAATAYAAAALVKADAAAR